MAKQFLDKDFLLESMPACTLYHEYAAPMPIFDYHCHIPPSDILNDRQFDNLTEIWLGGDHYKWRVMRACGVDERFITGDAPAEEKFEAWARVVPRIVRNPLYQWTHLELQRVFGVDELLTPETAREIYSHCTALLGKKEFSARSIIRKFRVEALCTTDDPSSTLEEHRKIRDSGFETIVAPAFRPDRALEGHLPERFNPWLDRLAELAEVKIDSFGRFIECLWKRHQYFNDNGCRLSDYGIETCYASDWNSEEVEGSFSLLRRGRALSGEALLRYRSAVLYELLSMDASQGWTQQLHLGAMRNNNSRMLARLGPDTGYDAMGDFEQGRNLSRLLDRLERTGKLGKTIVYSLNPRDNDMIPSILGCFQDGTVPGKMQMGSAWWFTDTKDGMTRQIEALSAVGVLSRFVGMLTDSRSLLSYPRHEYFRRILCNIIGGDVERGELPEDYSLLGGMVRDICYNNAKEYFDLHSVQ
ncbi:MAG: glucuronate isomerase [Synergistaceae bacterium]|nr:glucuronate isomerase [Synergistaceae bacterium]MDD3391486.1 glucuronate isomerase [Synergistaceae bacterium]MDD4022274.1 glucuronate isomerase [Synergistaceae bacterium]